MVSIASMNFFSICFPLFPHLYVSRTLKEPFPSSHKPNSHIKSMKLFSMKQTILCLVEHNDNKEMNIWRKKEQRHNTEEVPPRQEKYVGKIWSFHLFEIWYLLLTHWLLTNNFRSSFFPLNWSFFRSLHRNNGSWQLIFIKLSFSWAFLVVFTSIRWIFEMLHSFFVFF